MERKATRRAILRGAGAMVLAAAIPKAASARPRGPAPFRRGGVLFVGSSSIAMWKTRERFPMLPCVNAGVVGAHVANVNEQLSRLVLPSAPKVITFYAGDNDIAAGKSPERVLADFRVFLGRVEDRLSQTRIVFISLKPSLQRAALWPKMRRANELVRDLTKAHPRLSFADVATPMLDDAGAPRRELFIADGLHLSAEGYSLWTAVVTPLVEQAFSQP